VVVKKDNEFVEMVLAHHPFDVVGWDGYYYPWALSIHDFEPRVGRVHLPPPVHQTFEGDNFVVCSFCPRPYDFHPDAVPAPYNHSNVMSDEVLYYASSEFMSRKGIEYGSLTLHPDGLPHGPHPGRTEASIGQARTDELAVMVDTFHPLRVSADALPAEVSVSYSLTSAFADGQAEYTWKRDGDRYEITGTAQAVGFFTVFLEGQVEQSTTGRVTAAGLRPDRFTERLGSGPEEGLSFDWDARQVQFRYGDNNRRTSPLTDSSVDWLSMIFQLSQMPPKGDSMDLRVFTQRRLYNFRLQVVGFEELELPLGRANTLHLRHAGAKPEETVDVWLGTEQYYLPVKLRYPVARNRLVVEQTATSVKAR